MPLEPLEARALLAVQPLPLSPLKLSEAETRVSAALLALHDAVNTDSGDVAELAASQSLRVDAEERVAVTVLAADVAAVTEGLAALGFVATASFPSLHFVEGLLPVDALRRFGAGLAAKLGEFAVLPSYAPISFAGAATSQADRVMEADRVRGTLPGAVNGSGVKVGVISDSYNARGGAASDVASGDLPAGIQVVAEGPSNGSDEGRAMMQLIHDLAPGASLAFATAVGGQGAFANNIRALANPAIGNAQVLVDDIGYLDEPFFQDGVIAQAIDEVVTTRGVSYFSAAGNQATRAYESTSFTTAGDTIGGGAAVTAYDFDGGAGTDTRQRITIPAGAALRLSLQWDDPFFVIGSVDTDLDVYLVDGAGNIIASAASNNVALHQPVELLQYVNVGATAQSLDLVIVRGSGAGTEPGRIKYVNYGSAGITIDQFATNSSTVVPHASAANGQAVAAVPWFDQTAAEAFTSQGPNTILFSPTGERLAEAEVRQTVQIAAIDGVNNTFFGGADFEGDGLPNFFGTSAAAPHAAAVAALVRQANPSFTPAEIYTRLQVTADDITVTGVGYDNVTGHGLVNAYDAVFPTITPAGLGFLDGLEGGVFSSAYETRSTGNGRILVTGDNGPATGSRHVTMDAGLVTGSSGLNEVTLHVDATGAGEKILTFRQREFVSDEDDEMPESFTGSSDSDGVAISVDGVTWHRLISLTGAASTTLYTQHTINLTAAAAAAGITLSADTRIRFQQFDDFPIGLGDGMAFDDIEIHVVDTAPPAVTEVFVNGSTWTASFREFMASSQLGDATYGYRLTGELHADELPWLNLDQISVRFSEDVSLAADALRVFGVNVAQYGGSFTYDAATFTATWTLDAGGVFAADKLALAIDDAQVTDFDGNALDGEWANPAETTPVTAGGTDTFPSGDGAAGGDFLFRINVLPGDVNQDGQILGNDVTSVRSNQGFAPGGAGYSVFRDLTGDAEILGNDVTGVRSRQGIQLPDGEPLVIL